MSEGYAKQPLGIGALISESFRIFLKRLFPIFAIGFVIYFAVSLLSVLLLGFDVVIDQNDTLGIDDSSDLTVISGGLVIRQFIAAALDMLAQGLLVSVLVLLAYDTKLGNPLRLSAYIGGALPVAVTVMIVTVLVSIMIGLGIVALVIPGIWVAAVFSVAVPVVVIERAGLGALKRSAELTKDYRWPIVGLYVVVIFLALIFSAILGAVFMGFAAILLFDASGAISTLGALAVLIASSAVSAIAFGFAPVVSALLYSRLREIKDGLDVVSLVEPLS